MVLVSRTRRRPASRARVLFTTALGLAIGLGLGYVIMGTSHAILETRGATHYGHDAPQQDQQSSGTAAAAAAGGATAAGAAAAGTQAPGSTHTLCTSNGSPYQNYQLRIAYATYKLIQAMSGGARHVAFTRILHRTKADALMGEIETFRADPLQPACDDWCEYPVSDRGNAVRHFFDLAATNASMLRGEWIYMIESDYVFMKPLPLPDASSQAQYQAWGYPFDYINPKMFPAAMKKLYNGPAADIPGTGPAPMLMRAADWIKVTPDWERLTAVVEGDEGLKKQLGWVREMYAFSTALTLHGVQVELKPAGATAFITQLPIDDSLGNAHTFHYTQCTIYKTMEGNADVWAYDKRFHTSMEESLKVPPIEQPPAFQEGKWKFIEGKPVNARVHEAVEQMIGQMNKGIATLQPLQAVRPSGRASVAVSRQSGRYSQSSVHRGSRAASVVRGSVRYGKGGADSQGLPCERIVCIDEDGRDRTPKPLVSAPRHAGGGGLPVGPDGTLLGGGWGGDSLGPLAGLAGLGGGRDSMSERSSIISFGQLPTGSFSARSFLNNEPTEPSREPSFDGLPAGRSARGASVAYGAAGGGASSALGGGGGGDAADAAAGAAPLTVAIPDASRPDAQGSAPQPQQHRSRTKGTQCPRAARATRGIQTHPWELRSAAVAEAAPPTHRSQADGGGDGGGALGDDEEALLAMRSPGRGGGGGEGYAGHDWHGSTLSASQRGGQLSQSASRRGSFMGGSASRRESFMGGSASRRGSIMGYGRASVMHGDDDRPDTSAASRRTSIQTGEWSARNSISSNTRASFSAFARAEGRGSIMAGLLGSGGQPRGSVMQRQGGGAHGSAAPQPTAEEVAAAAARRQKAEQERALARMPGLLGRLQAAERAVLLNVRHAQLAQYHGVQLCTADPRVPEPGTAFPSVAPTARTAHTPHNSRPSTRRVPAALPAMTDLAEEKESAPVLAGLAAGAAAAALAVAEGDETPSAFISSPMHTSRQPIAELPVLWSWQCGLSGELPVSCLAFNPAAPGLLAVGYGRLEYAAAGVAALVVVWSLTNPTHPVWHVATPCGVSALDWSGKAPGQLAVGFFDGSVALYDVRATSDSRSSGSGGGGAPKPLARAPPAGGAPSAGGGHAEPVWRLRHVPKASDPGEEMLVSVSSDGRLLEWKHAQGLERAELLRLKRQQSAAARRVRQQAAAKAGGSAGAEGFLGRSAGGTCFDFCPADPRTYLVGTEDGGVHRCSTAFTEQSLGSYGGHLAPVYQVCWSPFSPSHFLTASADWSVRLWSEGQPHSLWTFQLAHSRAEVADVAFCPAVSTLFAAAAGNSLQLWDVERSVLAPRALGTRLGVRLTALAFSKADPVVVVGADDGAVTVYSLAGFGLPVAGGEGGDAGEPLGEQEQRQRFEAALRHHTAGAIAED